MKKRGQSFPSLGGREDWTRTVGGEKEVESSHKGRCEKRDRAAQIIRNKSSIFNKRLWPEGRAHEKDVPRNLGTRSSSRDRLNLENLSAEKVKLSPGQTVSVSGEERGSSKSGEVRKEFESSSKKKQKTACSGSVKGDRKNFDSKY